MLGQSLGVFNIKYFGLIAYVYPFLLIVLGYFVYKNFKKFDFDFAQFVVGIFLFFIAFLMFQALATSGANSGVIGGFIVSALILRNLTLILPSLWLGFFYFLSHF